MERSKVREVRESLATELAVISKKLGLSITLDPGSRYDASGGYFKITVAELGKRGETVDKMEIDFKRYAPAYGLKATDYKRKFEWGGETYTLVGIAPKSTRYPFIVKRSSGKLVKLPEGAVVSTLRAK